jgi:hypothetical protein
MVGALIEPLLRQLGRIELSARGTHMAQLKAGERYADPRCLTRHGYRCFSQNEEDGIVHEIFRRIGTTNRTFVEFGVEGGLENNTLSLLFAGWRGLWIEADPVHHASILERFGGARATGALLVELALVTAENIEEILERAQIPEALDFLCIDIDRNDYWVWNAIERFRPRVVVIEYNASLGPSARSVVPYDPGARWDGSVCFGASLGALEDLGRKKSYALVSCDLTGANAFFVRSDCLKDAFLPPYTAETHYEPPRYGASGAGHSPRWGAFLEV